MAGVQETDSGVLQPAGLQLADLNQRSASLGSWDVGIFNPGIERWTYIDKKSKSQKEGAAFRCYLVLLSDPRQYVRGEIGMRNSDLKPPQAAEKKFTANKSYRMSAVKFHTGTSQEYIHTPQKFVVNLSTTKLNPIMSRNQGGVIQPQPSMTLFDINELTQNQRFDVAALVEEVDEPQSIKNGRFRQSIKLIDNAVDRENVVDTNISFFSDDPRTAKDNATIDILRTAVSDKEPLTLFGLSGKKLGNGYSIENSKKNFVDSSISVAEYAANNF